MLYKIPKETMHLSNIGWLESRFHFSFANYVNKNNMNFGVLRVLNDDIIHPQSGFPTHPHSNMEIVSYVVNGAITHIDSMGNTETLKRGEVQYLSAGTGITHSEYNMHETKDLRLLQIWITPPKMGTKPLYGSYSYKSEERCNTLLKIVSPHTGDAKIKLHQNVNFYVCELDKGKKISHSIPKDKQIYFVQIEGRSSINNITLNEGDAMEIKHENTLDFNALTKSHFLFIEMDAS